MDERPIVLLPTYDERENLEEILDAILGAVPQISILVIDDASPDGTGELAQRRADADPRIAVLHRPGKQGLGRAYLDGMRWALADDRAFTHIFQMDADFSHDPRYLLPLLQACRDGADLAVGSRWVRGGGVKGWGPLRFGISRGGSLYARTVLGVSVRDVTAGFKCFTRRVLEAIPRDQVTTVGYGFQIEMTYRAIRLGFAVAEVPIMFSDRTRGKSKMSARIFSEAMTAVLRMRVSI